MSTASTPPTIEGYTDREKYLLSILDANAGIRNAARALTEAILPASTPASVVRGIECLRLAIRNFDRRHSA